jgi:hypothetical protein
MLAIKWQHKSTIHRAAIWTTMSWRHITLQWLQKKFLCKTGGNRPPLQEHTNLLTYVLTYLLAYSREQSPSWETNGFEACQEIPRILWNLKVHYRIHKCPPPVSILSQLSSIHTPHSTFWRPVLILSFHLSLGLPNPKSTQLRKFRITYKNSYVFFCITKLCKWQAEVAQNWQTAITVAVLVKSKVNKATVRRKLDSSQHDGVSID